jgi:hypothetical protein
MAKVCKIFVHVWFLLCGFIRFTSPYLKLLDLFFIHCCKVLLFKLMKNSQKLIWIYNISSNIHGLRGTAQNVITLTDIDVSVEEICVVFRPGFDKNGWKYKA